MTTVFQANAGRVNVMRVDGNNVAVAKYDNDGIFLGYQNVTKTEIKNMVECEVLKPLN